MSVLYNDFKRNEIQLKKPMKSNRKNTKDYNLFN